MKNSNQQTQKVNIYNIEYLDNRSKITLNVSGYGIELINFINELNLLCLNNKAQSMLFQNRSPYKFNTKLEFTGYQNGNFGGTITFHNHSCDSLIAMEKLLEFLNK